MAGLEQSKHAESMLVFNSKSEFDTLQSRVLKWSTDDITSSTLFKVKCIPMEFSSTEEYLGAFRVPFLEEVRGTLCGALEKSITQNNDGHAIVPAQLSKLTLDTTAKNQDQSMWKFNLFLSWEAQRSAMSLRASDLLLLCSEELPEWDAQRECLASQTSPQKFLLVYVNNVREESSVLSATACVQHGSPLLAKMSMAASAWHAVLLGMSLIPAERIWNSINKANSSGRMSKMFVMQDVLRINQQVVPGGINSLDLRQTPEGAGTLQRVEEYCKSRNLNDSQQDAVKSALAGLLTPDVKPHVRMVQGPPGTGKTAMSVTLISVLGCLQCRTLISAPTNAAVLEVCKRMMSFFQVDDQPQKEEKLIPQQEVFSTFCARVRDPQSRLTDSPSCRQCSPIELREIVLVGSVGGMEGVVNGNALMEKVFLPYRIQRLTAALNAATGWKGCVLSVESFLTASLAQFAWYYRCGNGMKDSSKESEEFGKRNEIDTDKQEVAENAAFWSFTRERIIEMQARMEEHLLVLLSELPKCHIDLETSKAMTIAFELMNSILDAMPSQPPLEATTWFNTTAVNTAPEGTIAKLSLSESHGSTLDPKLKFLLAREALLKALASRPGCTLLATEQNPQGREPKDEWLKSQCFKNATLVFCTVSAAGSPLMAGATFRCAIIDEASQLVEAASIIVSGMRDLNQLVLVGDHKQLPGTVISKVAEKCGYGRSLFDRLQSLQHGCRHMLNSQYRMTPEISHFPNSQFYESELKDGSNVLASDYGMDLAKNLPYGAYAFLNCGVGAEVAQPKGWKNPQEVLAVTKMVNRLGQERYIRTLSIGVISPYAMQVEALKQSFGQELLNIALDVEVKTVDGFQGNERDVIIFSAVRANPNKQIGFLNDSRRLNVAITRGRYCVWIVGNAETLSGGGEIWKKLITDAKARNCFYNLKD